METITKECWINTYLNYVQSTESVYSLINCIPGEVMKFKTKMLKSINKLEKAINNYQISTQKSDYDYLLPQLSYKKRKYNLI